VCMCGLDALSLERCERFRRSKKKVDRDLSRLDERAESLGLEDRD
jgi:hypothetical protein